MANCTQEQERKTKTDQAMSDLPPALGGTVEEILARGYLRYRHRSCGKRELHFQSSAQKPLDDVAPEGRVPPAVQGAAEREGEQ